MSYWKHLFATSTLLVCEKILAEALQGFHSNKTLAFSCQSVIFLREDKSMD